MNWVEKYYPLGKQMVAPHPDTGKWLSCRVTRHLLGGFNNGRIAGITVQFDDRVWLDIDDQYLREDGAGFWRTT